MTGSLPSKPVTMWRKALIMPSEHGAWGWLLVPFGVGTAVAVTSLPPTDWPAVLFTLFGSLSLFFMRQPATVWLRAKQGRARRADGPLALRWLLLLGAVGGLCLAGLLWRGRFVLLWLILPLLVLLVGYLAAARHGRARVRSLWMEVFGAAALAGMAPAALLAATGRFTGLESALWGLLAAQNVLGALYVRQRILDTHERPSRRYLLGWQHGLVLAMIVGSVLAGLLPWVTAVPFLLFTGRALWTAAAPRPVSNVKQFGFLELAVEIAGGFCFVLGYL